MPETVSGTSANGRTQVAVPPVPVPVHPRNMELPLSGAIRRDKGDTPYRRSLLVGGQGRT